MRGSHRSRSMFREEYHRSAHDNLDRYYNTLETRIMTLDDFLNEKQMEVENPRVGLPRVIPVLLLPGETTNNYEQNFELWLLRRNVTMGSLRGDPQVERRFRLDFAHSRAWDLQRQQGFRKSSPRYERIRSRRELLATEVLSAEMFMQLNEEEGLNGRMITDSTLRPISIILNRTESLDRYEINFKKWLENKRICLESLVNDPEEERRYRQCFAYARAKSHLYNNFKNASADGSTPRSQSSSSCRKRTSPRDFHYGHKDKRQRVRSGNSKEAPLFNDDLDTESQSSVSRLCLQKASNCAAETNNQGERSPERSSNTEPSERINAVMKMVARAEKESSTTLDKSLIENYSRMSEQIALNSTAVNDALALVKINTNIGKAEAMDHMRQINELRAVIDEEKRRRDTTFALIIAHEWRDQQEELERLVEDSPDTKSSSSHEKLGSVYRRLDTNSQEMQNLQQKLSNQLSWLKNGDHSRRIRGHEVQHLTNELREHLTTKERLEEQRKTSSVDLLRSNDGLKMLVLELMEEANQVWD